MAVSSAVSPAKNKDRGIYSSQPTIIFTEMELKAKTELAKLEKEKNEKWFQMEMETANYKAEAEVKKAQIERETTLEVTKMKTEAEKAMQAVTKSIEKYRIASKEEMDKYVAHKQFETMIAVTEKKAAAIKESEEVRYKAIHEAEERRTATIFKAINELPPEKIQLFAMLIQSMSLDSSVYTSGVAHTAIAQISISLNKRFNEEADTDTDEEVTPEDPEGTMKAEDEIQYKRQKWTIIMYSSYRGQLFELVYCKQYQSKADKE